MKDCSTCPFSPENDPSLKHKRWEDLECSKCKPVEPMGRHFRYQEVLKWETEPVTKTQARGYKFIYFMCSWLRMSDVQKKIVGEKLVNPAMRLSEIARKHHVTRQNVKAMFKRVIKQFPDMDELLK